MEIKSIKAGNRIISEIISPEILVKKPEDVLDILGAVNSEYVVMHTHNFEDDFFDLSTKKLGEALLKFTNYRIKLAIVGDFGKYPSKTLKEFIYESNKQRDYLFLPSITNVLERWKNI